MNEFRKSAEFQDELPGWTVRGVLCALNSGFWAVMAGFNAPEEIAGMLAGIMFWIGCFAGLCAWTPLPGWLKQPRFVAALKCAAWSKVGLTVVGWLGFAGAAAIASPAGQPLALFGMVDVLLGLASLWLVSRIAGLPDLDHVSRLDSFGWTTLATLVDGLLVASVITLIALAVLVWWRMREGGFRPKLSSPTRPAG